MSFKLDETNDGDDVPVLVNWKYASDLGWRLVSPSPNQIGGPDIWRDTDGGLHQVSAGTEPKVAILDLPFAFWGEQQTLLYDGVSTRVA